MNTKFHYVCVIPVGLNGCKTLCGEPGHEFWSSNEPMSVHPELMVGRQLMDVSNLKCDTIPFVGTIYGVT